MKKIKFSVLEKNNSFKVLTGKGRKGYGMEPHLSDKDAFFIVQKGDVYFDLGGTKSHLGIDGCISIPSNIVHSFEILEECEVLLMLDSSAKIRFV